MKERNDRFAVILAGGDGTRLRPLTRLLARDERPKQFCSLFGGGTLLDDTRRRVAHAVDPSRTYISLTKGHERFYRPLLADVARRQRVEQPANAGTGAAILYSLLHLRHENPAGSVAFVPSDHFVSDDVRFMSYVDRSFELAAIRPDLVVLIGIPPEMPETDYGWIEPTPSESADGFRWIRRFWEKPDHALARALMARGSLWNSFVMVGRIEAFLGTIRAAAPELLARFEAVAPAIGGDGEAVAVEELYAGLEEMSFSKDVLAKRPGSLAVLVADGVAWSDLGRPERALARMRGASTHRADFEEDLVAAATGRAAASH
jgi:mannose-1-phosphate guanylyltransferase